MMRFADEIYETNQASTIGVDFKIKTIVIDNKKIKLQIWDTAGQERFRAIVSNYYRGAHGILVVFDMTNKDSFTSLDEWIGEIKKNTKESVELLILGNKIDKASEIVISDEEIANFLEKHKIKKESFVKTSAKENLKVFEAFETLAKRLISKFESGNFDSSKKEGFNLRSGDKEGGRCCM